MNPKSLLEEVPIEEPNGPCHDEEAEELLKDQKCCQFSLQDEAGRDLDFPAGEPGQEDPPHAGQEHHQVEGDAVVREPRKLLLIVSK